MALKKKSFRSWFISLVYVDVGEGGLSGEGDFEASKLPIDDT